MSEEVEVTIRDVADRSTEASQSLIDGLRKLLLASIGAVAISRDESEAFVQKLVERGELAQKDAEKLLRSLQNRLRQGRPDVQQQVDKVSARVEQGLEEFLNRLNIPTKRDIDDLSEKIANLAARVEELRKQS